MSYPHLGPLLQILAAINYEENVGLDRLQEITGLSHPTLKRPIQTARQYGVIIEGRGAGYVIQDGGGAIKPAWRRRQPTPVGYTQAVHQ